ncbi:MAG: hypothetical protein IJL97_02925 [Lachnospiraceae bacterium]|nr:hypothetical protein [Lachnospiraceae bacterium]
MKEDIKGYLDKSKTVFKMFTKKTYEPEFEAYYERNLPALKEWCEEFETLEQEDHKAGLVRDAADILMAHQEENLKDVPKRKLKMEEMEGTMLMSLFAIPAINHYGHPFGDKLCDELIERWHTAYPKFQIQRGTYEELLGGFKKSFLSWLTGRR